MPVTSQMAVGQVVKSGTLSTSHGTVLWDLAWTPRGSGSGLAADSERGTVIYVQTPWSTGFINPITAWSELVQLGEARALLSGPSALLLAIVPVGVLFGLLASRRLVRRVRRLEEATLAVADGDYTVTGCRRPAGTRSAGWRRTSPSMTRQLSSALAAERQRATSDARAAERARIAREIHDAISQHLFGLRMIAAGMRRADPGNQQARAIERISEEALRDMQTLLAELRPASLDGAGLAVGPARHLRRVPGTARRRGRRQRGRRRRARAGRARPAPGHPGGLRQRRQARRAPAVSRCP